MAPHKISGCSIKAVFAHGVRKIPVQLWAPRQKLVRGKGASGLGSIPSTPTNTSNENLSNIRKIQNHAISSGTHAESRWSLQFNMR